MEGNVYIFDFGDKIKAGYSTNVAKRQRTIELSSGVKARNVYSVSGGRKEEKILHSYLDNRLEGEFFSTPFETAKEILSRITAGEITARRGGKVSKAQQKAVNKYMKANYDRVNVTLPKGHKAEIAAHAATRGESVNGFIGRAIAETMERDNGGGTNSPADAAQNAVERVSGSGPAPIPDGTETPSQAAQSGGEGGITL